jgi:hypothetical protein
LLWWTLITPQQLKSYQEQFGEAAVKETGKWLVSFLIWLPFLYPTLGLETLPRTGGAFSPTTYLWISGALFIAWLFTGIFGDSEDDRAVVRAIVLTVGMMLVLTVGLTVGLTAGLMTGAMMVFTTVLTVGLTVGLTLGFMIVFIVVLTAGLTAGLTVGLMVGLAVEESLKTGHASWLARGTFGLLVAAHVFLGGSSLWGGGRVVGQ